MAAATVQVTSCQICGSERARLMFEDPPYRVVRCEPCSLVYVTPRLHPDRLPEVYGERYWKSDTPKTRGYADYASDERLYLKTFRRRLRFVRRWIGPQVKVLDVGCAAGFFLRVMQECGHDVYGVELSSAIAEQAVRHLGADRIHIGTLDSLTGASIGGKPLPADGPFANRSFDLVTLWDVIEHVPQPQELLVQVRMLLKPGGLLILETQNVDSAFARMLGRRWQHFKHEEHLYHFNPRTITRLLEQCGFSVEHNAPDYGGKYVSFGFIAERAQRLGRVPGLLLRPLALLKRANLYVNVRDEMVVVARPSESTNS